MVWEEPVPAVIPIAVLPARIELGTCGRTSRIVGRLVAGLVVRSGDRARMDREGLPGLGHDEVVLLGELVPLGGATPRAVWLQPCSITTSGTLVPTR
jgi:hypothetical protein